MSVFRRNLGPKRGLCLPRLKVLGLSVLVSGCGRVELGSSDGGLGDAAGLGGTSAGGAGSVPSAGGSSSGGSTANGSAGASELDAGNSADARPPWVIGQTPPSCIGETELCGPDSDSCCATLPVQGGSVALAVSSSVDDIDDVDTRIPVNVGSFALDKYEVTLGRFRKFLADYDAWRNLGHPEPGEGGHPRIPGLGWQERYAGDMPESAELFEGRVRLCSEIPLSTLDLPNAPSQVPLNCVSWYEAAAFCTWDGGRLPSYAESYYAAVGGALDRTYPWGDDPPPSQVYALYGCGFGLATPECTAAYVLPVGSHPAGAGLYGQHDLAGSLNEWLLDGSPAAYTEGCTDCGALSSADEHYWRGGSWQEDANSLRSGSFVIADATLRLPFLGLRCARDP